MHCSQSFLTGLIVSGKRASIQHASMHASKEARNPKRIRGIRYRSEWAPWKISVENDR